MIELSNFSTSSPHLDPALFAKIVSKIPNRHLQRYIKDGLFARCHAREYVGRRLGEYITLCRALGKADGFEALHRKLIECNLEKPSNSMLSPLSRQKRIEAECRRAHKIFRGVQKRRLYFETIIIGVLYGSPAEVIRQVQGQISAFRRKIRNHVAHVDKNHQWYKGICKIGYFEIERYRYTTSAYQNKKDARNWKFLIAKQMKRLGSKKLRLVQKLGWEPNRAEDFYILHFHAITNLKDRRAYKKRLKRPAMFPLNYQVQIKHLNKNQSIETSIRIVVAYMLKAAPRQGRFLNDPLAGKILPQRALIDFALIYDNLGFKRLRFHFNNVSRAA